MVAPTPKKASQSSQKMFRAAETLLKTKIFNQVVLEGMFRKGKPGTIQSSFHNSVKVEFKKGTRTVERVLFDGVVVTTVRDVKLVTNARAKKAYLELEKGLKTIANLPPTTFKDQASQTITD